MEDDIEACNPGLYLGLGMEGYVPKKKKQKENKHLGRLDLPFELCPKLEEQALHSMDHAEEENKMDDHINTSDNNCRKKLRLTKEQSALLEDSFKLHSTLDPARKRALAEQLNLKPRQIEVWFQNRRARTKVKQTEVDCAVLKKCCENLRDENRRLKKELQELRALKVGPMSPLYIQLSKAATLTMCSSCENLFKPTNEPRNNNNHKFQNDRVVTA